MPILDGSDDGEFYTEPDSLWQKDGNPWQKYNDRTDSYPTTWAPIQDVYGIEYRQTTADTYQLRSLTHIVTVNLEGFATYIRDPKNVDDFEWWCTENNVKIEERET
jgi:hypothetical protein